MSYYSDARDDPAPPPSPPPIAKPSMALVAIIIAVAGLFLPFGGNGWTFPLPNPVPPFVEPVIDASKTKGSWVIVVEQTEARSTEAAKMMRDLPYWQSLEKRGLKWRHYDYDSDDARPYRVLADAIGMPAVLVMGGQGELAGKVLDKFKLPVKETLDAKIKEATGR